MIGLIILQRYRLKFNANKKFGLRTNILSEVDPNLKLEDQTHLLPYKKHFEFPRNKLRLTKQLGAGEFGVVYKAIARGIQKCEQETIVAVKMLKNGADDELVRALVAELKIMIYLGPHPNVVDLLGAVTENIHKSRYIQNLWFTAYICRRNVGRAI